MNDYSVLLTLQFAAGVFDFQVAAHTDHFHDIRHRYGTVCHHAVDIWLSIHWNDKTKHLR